MKQSLLSVRMDAELKKEFDGFCAEVGLSSSAAINMFVHTVLREKRIPFEITNQPRAAIREAEREVESGSAKSYASAGEIKQDILK